MFITIYYGDQKSLLFNPRCSVVNLLNSIKERCGYGDTDRVLDLTDETGLVLELSSHKNEYATKYLSSNGSYVLVEKLTDVSQSNDPNGTALPQEVRYVPLLQSPGDKFKGYKARVAERRPSQEPSANRNTVSRGGKKGARLGLKQRKSFVESTSPV